MNNDIDLLPLEELAVKFGGIKRVYENSPSIDRIEFTYQQLFEFVKNVQKRERLTICDEIKKQDDLFYSNREGKCSEHDHEMDAGDCIKVILGK